MRASQIIIRFISRFPLISRLFLPNYIHKYAEKLVDMPNSDNLWISKVTILKRKQKFCLKSKMLLKNETLKLPLIFGKFYLIKMAKASKIQIKTQTLTLLSEMLWKCEVRSLKSEV
jgi:hypothetical protein